MATTSRQLDLPIRTWGGRRRGAGRKPAPGRRMVPHRRRGTHDRRCPVHVTMRSTPALPSLRQAPVFAAIRGALSSASRDGFRVVQFSVQNDHVHLLVEADAPARFTRGVQGLAIRVAKAVNATLARHGRVWADRFHARLLRTPREVRNALVYVLNNWRKHAPAARGLDARSSAAWFDGWLEGSRPSAPGPSPVAAARTWLGRIVWRRGGQIRVEDAPGKQHPVVRRHHGAR
jgi:REP-associated tyrosine transposase